MEARKITIVSTKTQRKSVIMSGAETLGQLKQDLTNEGIDYEDMTFYEGTSKTELKTDDSVLPKDVPYTNRTTGVTTNTNELVFMLTNTNKKIKSGAVSRAEVYNAIKNYGLESACKDRFGKNFTQCSTANLAELIKEYESSVASTPCACVDNAVRAAVIDLVILLEKMDIFNSLQAHKVLNHIDTPIELTGSPYSDADIDDMFEGML